MSRRSQRIGLVFIALLAIGPPGIGEEEIKGRGFAAFQKPPAADNPPADWTADEYEHDVASGEVFDLTDHYDLRQGPLEDNKARWKTTDQIRWIVNGATLKADGQIHDADGRQPTIATSEAWGAHFVHAGVTTEEGDFGSINAENRISFRYAYLISGRYVAEASVQLNGAAYDLDRKDHVFHLSEQSGESVASEENGRASTELRARLAGSKGLVVSSSKVGASVKQEAEIELTSGEQLDVRVNRRFSRASGDNASSPTVLLHDSVSGATPLDAHWEVFSEADVTLRARAGRIPGSNESAPVLVKLTEFRVENTLRVWKTTGRHRPPPVPGDAPPSPDNPDPAPGPVTPGSGNGGTKSDSGSDPDPEPVPAPVPQPDPAGDKKKASATLPLDDGAMVLATGVLVAPHGLAGEAGSSPGRVRIVLGTPAPRELRFAVAIDPATALELAQPELIVPAGSRHGGVAIHGVVPGGVPGGVGVTLQLLGSAGAPIGAALDLRADVASVEETPMARLWAALPGKAPTFVRASLRALAGAESGVLRIGRLGFADLDRVATVVGISVNDPAGILLPLPDEITIAPGALTMDVSLGLTATIGSATIVLRLGDAQAIVLHVRSVTQTWRSATRIRVPLGARASVPLLLEHAEPTPRIAEASSDAPGVATVDSAVLLGAGERLGRVVVRGAALGTTELRVRSEGLSELVAAVEVTPVTVDFLSDRLEVSALDGTRDGSIFIWAPPGARIVALEVPADAREYVDVLGVGTSEVELVFHASPDLPERLSLPISFAGTTGPLEIDILDTVHGPADGVRASYRLVAR